MSIAETPSVEELKQSAFEVHNSAADAIRTARACPDDFDDQTFALIDAYRLAIAERDEARNEFPRKSRKEDLAVMGAQSEEIQRLREHVADLAEGVAKLWPQKEEQEELARLREENARLKQQVRGEEKIVELLRQSYNNWAALDAEAKDLRAQFIAMSEHIAELEAKQSAKPATVSIFSGGGLDLQIRRGIPEGQHFVDDPLFDRIGHYELRSVDRERQPAAQFYVWADAKKVQPAPDEPPINDQ